MKMIRTTCPLDCWDSCAIEVTVKDNVICNVKGDPHHPITKGSLCVKGVQHLERLNSPNRLTSPMKKVHGEWVEISWDQAISEIGDKLIDIKKHAGTDSIMYYAESGHNGILKNIDQAFFNTYGGVVMPQGNLCFSAGFTAQCTDFGNALSHDPEDHLNAKTIIVWGRNPANTNLHLVPFLEKAKANGTNIVVIDPIKTPTADIATHYFQIKPEADGFLALAMAKLIIDSGSHDDNFTKNHSENFDDYKANIAAMKLDELIAKTGLSENDVRTLVRLYAQSGPAAIILGYGPQRYRNGGKNIRLIDALGALTGNIGIPGGGVTYANIFVLQWVDGNFLTNSASSRTSATFKKPLFPEYVLQERKGEIQGIFVTRSNPVIQMPNTDKVIEAFNRIPFKVVLDHFMTDTAQLADYVLPCTHIYEEEDFLHSAMWHSYFHYTERVVAPVKGVKSEFEIYSLLAAHMQMSEFTEKYPDEKTYLKGALAPLLKDLNITLEEMQGQRMKKEGNDIPWKVKKFTTPSGKFNFIVPKLEDWIYDEAIKERYPLHLLTIQPVDSLHSQHFMDKEDHQLPAVYCNQQVMDTWSIKDGHDIVVESPDGSINAKVKLDNRVGNGILAAHNGWWLKNQGVNRLTPSGVSDIGDQAIFNNCMCRIRKIN